MRTFDNTNVDYHGTCRLTLTEACTPAIAAALGQITIPEFEVFSYNNKWTSAGNGWWPASVRLIGLVIGSDEVTLERECTWPSATQSYAICSSGLPTAKVNFYSKAP